MELNRFARSLVMTLLMKLVVCWRVDIGRKAAKESVASDLGGNQSDERGLDRL